MDRIYQGYLALNLKEPKNRFLIVYSASIKKLVFRFNVGLNHLR